MERRVERRPTWWSGEEEAPAMTAAAPPGKCAPPRREVDCEMNGNAEEAEAPVFIIVKFPAE